MRSQVDLQGTFAVKFDIYSVRARSRAKARAQAQAQAQEQVKAQALTGAKNGARLQVKTAAVRSASGTSGTSRKIPRQQPGSMGAAAAAAAAKAAAATTSALAMEVPSRAREAQGARRSGLRAASTPVVLDT